MLCTNNITSSSLIQPLLANSSSHAVPLGGGVMFTLVEDESGLTRWAKVITPVIHLFSAIYRGYNSVYNDRLRAHLVQVFTNLQYQTTFECEVRL